MRKIFTIIIMLTVTLAANAGNFKPIYMYGMAMSFNDSTVYITDIQMLDSAWIEKNGFLYSRENYSYQLKNYMQAQGMLDATPITFFAEKKKDIEKKYIKTRKRYTQEKYNYNVKYIAATDFRYERIEPTEQEMKKDSGTKKEDRKKAKEAKKAKKKANKDMKKGIRPDIENMPQM